MTAFLEHIIIEAVYGQESFRTQCVYGQESFRTQCVYGQESFRTQLCTIKRSLNKISTNLANKHCFCELGDLVGQPGSRTYNIEKDLFL